MMKKRNLFLLLLLFMGNLLIFSQSCTINAGANKPICGTSTTLQATAGGAVSSSPPTWSIVSKPPGATDPVFSNPNVLNPTVTEINSPGNYIFRITQPCTTGAPAVSDVTITAPGSIAGFTAGPDITGISALIGEATLNATIPNGYTASWTYYNLYSFEFNTAILTDNATMSNTTTATPTLTLGSKANHTIDPAYRAVLRITSTNNPNCWYEDNAIVRFTPNPNMLFPATYSQCLSPGTTGANFYYDPSTNSPRFSTTTTNSSGNSAYGTIVTMTPVTQPAGGDIQYSRMVNGRLYFSGITAIGAYVFDLNIQNSLGSYTQRLTYNFNGFQPNAMTFVDSAYPNQTELYSSGSSGGAVFCNMAGSTNDITFYYKLNSADPPTLTSSVALSGPDNPSGGAPLIVQNGAGTANRSATLTPPAGGWRVGTYRFAVTLTAAGGCSRQSLFYVHISDNARPAVNVNNITVCYSGSGVVSATVPLPASYIAPVSNPSYLQGYGGRYDFTVVSRPTGSAVPSFEAQAFRTLTSASTVISNLDRAGEYVFRIKAVGNGSGKILTDEYACSGTSLEDTFSIFVTPQVNSNAGSDQNIVTTSTTTATLNGNNPGTSTGTWSLVTKPAGAPDPVIVTPSAPNSSVTGMHTVGAYTFRWTIATGSCTSFDDVIVNVNAASPAGVSNGLTYWYRADVNAANTGTGTDVTGWTDVWSGTTVAQLGTNALPKYVVGTSSYFNFNPGINFTAVTQSLGNTSVRTISSLSFDIFTLTKENILGTGNNNRLFSSLVDNSLPAGAIERWDGIGLMTDQGYPNMVERVNNAYGSRYLANPGSISRSTLIPSIMYHRFTDTTISKGLNGAANGGNGTHGARGLMNGGHAFGDTRFSGNGSDNGGFTGNIGETIIYGAGALSDTERRRVDSYLAIKYGITLGQVNTAHYLDADAAIVWNGATNTAYNNNIFGIAREDIGVFQQKVSKSVNAGAILTVATTNDFVNPNNNAARTGFANDKTYFLLGDNDVTSNTLATMNVNGTTMQRIQRTWLSQRTNAAGTLYFEADLSSYGNAFASGSNVEMIIADDAVFTTNAIRVTGTYTGGKWVFSNNFNPDNNQRYITFARAVASNCVTDCNPNTYVNSINPNTIEYDNMVSGFHATIIKESNGVFKTWGEYSANSGNGHNLSPTEISVANGYNYTGTPLKATMGSNSEGFHQSALLTTDGLYVWGVANVLISNTIKNTRPFQKITVDGNSNGLPTGVTPADVKMMFGSHGTLAITTCIGDAWVLSFNGSKNGDGTAQNATNNVIWHKIKTEETGNPDLTDVVALRGTSSAMLALTSSGKLYTWGTGTFINSGIAANRTYATEITIPNGVAPKMIGMTQTSSGAQSYYLLATDGKLYAMGNNASRQLGDGTTTASNVWKEVTATSTVAGTTYTLGGNIVWISPNEHNGTNVGQAAINVLTNGKKQWAWGSNDGNMLGSTSTPSQNPTYMSGNSTAADGLALTDNIIAVETGGHTTINIKEGSNKFGYVGHRAYGSMGDGSSANNNVSTYSYSTAVLSICGAETVTALAPFTCDTKFYLTQYGSAATDKTILYTLDNTTNPFTKTIIGESPAGMKVNGIGYNTVDNFLYGMRTDAANATHMVKIDATGTFTDLGAVTSLPAGGFNAGGFDNAGNYYIINFDSSNLYRINLSTNTATQITLSRSLKVNDIAFDSTTNLFYGYEQSTGRLVSINTSGVVTNVGSPSTLGNVFFGAMYSDSNGDIFGNEDDGSGFYQFNKTTGQATKISESISAFGNDGANCSNAVITFPADLSITKTDGKTTYIPGSATTYTIVVSNNSGAYGVLGATVSDPVPAGIPAANVSYSVPVLTGGATTSITGPQTGALNDVVGLPIGGTITYTVTVNVPLAFTGNLTNTVTVTPPVNSTDPNNSNNTATDTNTNGVCYKPGITAGTALDTKVGITTLSRAGATDTDNWPMARKGGWVALESKTKGFVPNRVAFTDADTNPATPDTPVGIAAANFREGMMVYDTTNKCLKVYTMKDGDTSMAWHCVTTQTCPD